MGAVDEHWCSECKKSVDKKQEEYLELTHVNDPLVLGCTSNKDADDKVERFPSGILCKKCAVKMKVLRPIQKGKNKGKMKEETFWTYLKHLRRKGNPVFEVALICKKSHVCETHQQEVGIGDNHHVECAHLAVDMMGRLYCKRRHPGSLELTQEKAVVDEQKMGLMGEFFFEVLSKHPMGDQIFGVLESAPGLDLDHFHDPDPLRTGADIGKPPKPGIGSMLKDAVLRAKAKSISKNLGFPPAQPGSKRCEKCKWREIRNEDGWCYMFKEEPEGDVCGQFKLRGESEPMIQKPVMLCAVCGKVQKRTPSGLVCENGHGGAESIAAVVNAPYDLDEAAVKAIEESMRPCGRCGKPLGEDRYRWRELPGTICLACLNEVENMVLVPGDRVRIPALHHTIRATVVSLKEYMEARPAVKEKAQGLIDKGFVPIRYEKGPEPFRVSIWGKTGLFKVTEE